MPHVRPGRAGKGGHTRTADDRLIAVAVQAGDVAPEVQEDVAFHRGGWRAQAAAALDSEGEGGQGQVFRRHTRAA